MSLGISFKRREISKATREGLALETLVNLWLREKYTKIAGEHSSAAS